MAEINFTVFWDPEWQKKFRMPPGFLVLKTHEDLYEKVGLFFKKIKSWQAKKEKLIELNIKLDVHYKKRTMAMNNLMWALYDIEANEQNGGLKGPQAVSAEDLYEADLLEYGPRIQMVVAAEHVEFIKREYRVEKQEPFEGGVGLTVILTTSHFDTRQMAEWIDRIFRRIAENGIPITDTGSMRQYWQDYRQYLNDQQILLNESEMTSAEYKTLNPLCEACGEFIGAMGDLFHIKARGMGGNPELEKNYPSNWLHTCRKCHEFWHDQGESRFLKKYSHLKFKITTALKRDYD